MTGNFLPEFHPVVTHGAGDTIQCLIRDKAVRATPEERVRQRVLHWLIHDKGWRKEDLRLEKSYAWVSDPARTRIRPDVELLVDRKVIVVVECKRSDVPLDERVDRQAIEYAIKAGAQWIWITNGRGHAFLAKQGSHWRPIDSLKPLNVISKAPSARLDFPASADDPASVARYWQAFGDCQFLRGGDDYDPRFVLAVHRVLFDVPNRNRLRRPARGRERVPPCRTPVRLARVRRSALATSRRTARQTESVPVLDKLLAEEAT